MKKERVILNLKRIRQERGLTLGQLARKLGVTSQAIYTWEAHTRSPSATMLRKLADALQCGIDDLVSNQIVITTGAA